MAKYSSKKIFFYFLIGHFLIWILVPSIFNTNLPRDTIEALAWGSNLDWGFEKHPPLSAFFPEIFYKIFGNKDWAYYLLSQIFVVLAFLIVWVASHEFFKNNKLSLMSVLLLEGIYFYNFTTPEFNVNICQLPFWSLSVLFAWKAFKHNKNLDWILFGLFSALGMMSKYLFVYLLFGIISFYFYRLVNKKFHYKSFISLLVFLIVLSPHLIWLVNNDYITINYALHRTSGSFYLGEPNVINHIKYPLIFLLKQIGILIPFFIMSYLVISKFKFKLNFKDEGLVFLICINILPLIFLFLTSFLFGVKIRTMWVSPFYLYFGILIIYFFKNYINYKNTKNFFISFIIFFTLSPVLYSLNSLLKTDQRIDYPAEEISFDVKNKWDRNFKKPIDFVVGQAWWAGNLSYHLESRPKFVRGYLNFKTNRIGKKRGVVYIENKSSMLSKTCPGVSFITHSMYICMMETK